MFWFILIVFLTVFVSANCSLYEAVLYSTRPGALEALKAEGKRAGMVTRMMQMKRHIAGPIAAILILNTIANTAGATISGMLAARELGEQWVLPFSVGLTLAILIFAEIIPKTIGAVHWRTFWAVIVWPLTFIKVLLAPLVWMTQKLSNALTGSTHRPAVTEDDILGVARLGTTEGQISEIEGRMLENVINLEERQVRDVMTPRTVVFSLPDDMVVRDAYAQAEKHQFARIPVYHEDREDIVGYVTRDEIGSAHALETPEAPISGYIRAIRFVPETANCLSLLMTFLKARQHMAVVSDEFGGLAGVVTLEDVLEAIIGFEIVDESDRIADLRAHARSAAKERTKPNREREE